MEFALRLVSGPLAFILSNQELCSECFLCSRSRGYTDDQDMVLALNEVLI